jgi:hypothetical protein
MGDADAHLMRLLVGVLALGEGEFDLEAVRRSIASRRGRGDGGVDEDSGDDGCGDDTGERGSDVINMDGEESLSSDDFSSSRGCTYEHGRGGGESKLKQS